MSEPGWPRHGLSIGRQEFRRTVRAIRDDSTRLALLAFGGLFFALFVLGGTWLVLQFGDEISSYSLTDGLRGGVTIYWAFLAFIFAQRGATRYDRIDNESLMLLTVSVRSVLLGLVSAEVLRVLSYGGLPVLLLGGAFVYATTSPLAVPFLLVALALLLLSALVAGYTVGLVAKLLVARVRVVARYKSALGVVSVLAFFGLYFLFQTAGLGGLTAVLGLFPLSWLADLAVVGSPVAGSTSRAAVAAIGSLAWIVGWWAVLERIATALWFGDSVESEVAEEKATVNAVDAADPLAAAISPLALPPVSQPVLRVAQRSIVVARRNPSRLTVLMLPIIALGSSLISFAQAGDLFAVLPPVLALALPWLAGGIFGLNPFGDEGPVLPATLTSLPSGRQYAMGIALPGVVYGVPLAVVATAATGLYGPYAPGQVALLVALTAVFCLFAVALAPAVGTTLPRFESMTFGRGREVVPPSLSAAIVYSLVLIVPGATAVGCALVPGGTRGAYSLLVGGLLAFPFSWLSGKGLPLVGGVGTWLGGVGDAIAGIPVEVVHWGGYGGVLAVAVLLGLWSFRAVGRRYEGYTVD